MKIFCIKIEKNNDYCESGVIGIGFFIGGGDKEKGLAFLFFKVLISFTLEKKAGSNKKPG
jgi:hypothetical protein